MEKKVILEFRAFEEKWVRQDRKGSGGYRVPKALRERKA
jgi:hypothetical protein